MKTHQVNISNTLEKRIDVLALETKCKETKSMIANSRVVNEVDNKFIVFVNPNLQDLTTCIPIPNLTCKT